MNAKYLVRPGDFSIFEIDPSNNCYRGYNGPTDSAGNKPKAYDHFTYDILVNGYGFFPISEDEIPIYEKKCHEHYEFVSWQCRSDGHDGTKGGTYEEFLKYKQRVKEFNEKYPKNEKI